jgi:hypothetical protein
MTKYYNLFQSSFSHVLPTLKHKFPQKYICLQTSRKRRLKDVSLDTKIILN